MYLPVLPTDNIELGADSVLVVKGATLHVARDHEIERGVGRLVRVIDGHVIATDSHLI